MARDRLQRGAQNQYGDHSAPGANSGNPYAAAAAPSNNPYASAQPSYPPAPQQQTYATPTSYGQQDKYSAGGQAGHANGGGSFWNQLDETNALLKELQSKIGQVREAHQSTLNSTDQHAVKLADEVSKEARDVREDCLASIKQLYKVASSKAERKQAESAKANLKTLLQEHQTIEQQYRKQTADRVARQYRIVKPDASQQEIDQAVNSDNPQVFTQALLNTNRMGQARGAYREVQDRHVEIQKIERTMGELAQMFNEMSMLVEQQDEAITHVEAQTQQVDSDIARGNTEIDGAIIKAKKARRKKWICFWIIIIILCIVGIVVGVTVGINQANKKN